MFYSQIQQDRWVLEKLNFKRKGFFVDIGAYDGVQLSNSYTMEKDFAWSGVCVECNPFLYSKLVTNRTSHICNKAIWTTDNEVVYFHNSPHNEEMLSFVSGEVTDWPVKTITLNSLLASFAPASKEVDYISLDIEGSELEILNSFNFNEYDVKCWTIEHNVNLYDQKSIDNFASIVKKLLDNNYLVKWHEWDVFAIKDTFETQYFKNGERVKW